MKLNLFQKTAIITVITTVGVILMGSLVRASGAGLGCPDWPRCFGMWIPPMTAAELPPQYDATLFNPLHTWLEYINRLTGALAGIMITITFFASFHYRKKDPVITIFSGLALVMVLFQAWLGGLVVRSGLSAGLITVHMVIAMTLLAVLLYATFRAFNERSGFYLQVDIKKKLLWVSGLLFLLTMAQLVLGTQVREAVDVAKNVLELPRAEWLGTVDGLYEIHRSFSWLLVLATAVLLYMNRKYPVPRRLNTLSLAIAGLIFLQILIGIGLEKFDMAGVFQVLHLVGVSILICTILIYYFSVWFSNRRI
ncbi:MAG TPA: COX15/CtaA family protein [Balneolaceae bacterium]|nr:COX15/CtaA family protein [Balneolaceae bacterium]